MAGSFRHIIGLVAIIIVAGGFYYMATTDNVFSAQKSRADLIDKKTELARTEIINPLLKLNTIMLDESIFSSPEYKTLQDKSLQLNPPVLIRTNPFSPVN